MSLVGSIACAAREFFKDVDVLAAYMTRSTHGCCWRRARRGSLAAAAGGCGALAARRETEGLGLRVFSYFFIAELEGSGS